MYVNCIGDMTTVFFCSILETSAGFFYVRKVAIFFWAGPFLDHALFNSLGSIEIHLRVLAPWKMTCALVYQKCF